MHSLTATITETGASSCNGPKPGSRDYHYKISQIVICQTDDFRWKVMIFSPAHCELVKVFNNPDAMGLWINDVARLHTWALVAPVGLDKAEAA